MNIKGFLLVVMLVFFLNGLVLADCVEERFEQPLLITSLGQNPDGLMVKVVLEKIGVEFEYLPLAGSGEMEGINTLIITAGVSCKGLAASDIRFDYELKRASNLQKRAGTEGVPVIFVHLGGDARRDNRSNQLIELIAPQASYLIIYRDSNNDQYFTHLAEKEGIPLQIVEKLFNMGHIFSELLVE